MMKKCGSLLAIFVLAVFLAACGTDDAGSSRNPNGGNDAGGDATTDIGGTDIGTDGSSDAGDDTCTGPGCGSSGDLCASDEHCTDPEVCTVDRSGDSVELSCQNPTGTGGLGDSCSSDSECASNLCVDGECATPCERPADCSTDGSFICEETELQTDGGGSEDVAVCVRRPAEQCSSNADCSAPEQCVARKTSSEVVFECGTPNSGGQPVGGTCTDDADCAQNLCTGGVCSAPCAANGDCSAGDGFSCEIAPVDLGNGNTDNAQVCTAARSCTSKDDCRIGEVCHVDRTSGEATCRQPNTGGGALGDQCTDDLGCAANLCHEGRFRDACTVPCADDTDCQQAGYECGTASIDDGSGSTTDVNVCVPVDPPACSSNDDCASGLSCAIVPNAAGNALETACIPTSGGSATGVACTVDEDCASLVCLDDGTCSVPCTDSNQCAGVQLCQTNNVSKGGLSGDFDICETLPDERCDQTGTCSDGVRMCNDIRVASSGTGREAFCGMPNSGAAGGLGDHCADRNECRSAMCFNGTSDECTVICTQDSHCGPGQVCTTFSVSGTQMGYCISGCADNGSCSGLAFTNAGGENIDHVCTTNENTRDDNVDQICVRRNVVDPNDTSAGLLGDTCTGGNDCQSGLCLTNTVYNGVTCNTAADCNTGQVCSMSPSGVKECGDQAQYCTRVCDESTDCSGGVSGNQLTSCDSDISVTLSSGTVDTISACSPN